MVDDEQGRAAEHSAGATVGHCSPFSGRAVVARRDPPPPALISRWIKPLYLLQPTTGEFRDQALRMLPAAGPGVVGELLSYFDWRPRHVGSLLAALLDTREFEPVIATLLVRSDVCYAGRSHLLALALFDSERGLLVIREYLDWYLTQPQLHFEQADAMAALAYLDGVHRTDVLSAYLERWSQMAAGWPGRASLDDTVRRFAADAKALLSLRQLR